MAAQTQEVMLGSRSCPQCGAGEAHLLRRYSTDAWHVAACDACRFVYLRNPPAYDRLTAEFAWEKTSEAEAERRRRRRPMRRFEESVLWPLRRRVGPTRGELYRKLFRPGRVLDVGCAEGDTIPEPFIPFGIEISRAYFERANARMSTRGGRVVHGGGAIAIAEFPPRYFTGVILRSVLEHEVEPIALLKGVERVLDEGGVAYVRVPNFASPNRLITGRAWCGIRHPEHVNYFTPRSLVRMAAAAGLTLRQLHPLRVFDDNINALLTRASRP
jgi:SAM-dependent methyltransferase